MILACGGTTANTRLVSDLDRSAVNEQGFIKVDQYLQLKPSAGNHSPLKNGVYFAAGDCCDSPGGPTGLKAANDAGVAAKKFVLS
jgi:thioredoxin reductase